MGAYWQGKAKIAQTQKSSSAKGQIYISMSWVKQKELFDDELKMLCHQLDI